LPSNDNIFFIVTHKKSWTTLWGNKGGGYLYPKFWW